MQFHLNYSPPKFDFTIDHSSKVFFIGSCFSENIGNLLSEHKFKTYSNPNGILFNPISIYNCLNNIVDNTPFDENLILMRDDVYYSFLHHSSISSNNKTALLEKINSENKKAHQFLKECDQLIITFGTAFLYQHLELDKTVANCHKQAASSFEKRLISVTEIIESYSTLFKKLQEINPKLKLIFTVSPVKHLKDGIIENNLSKSTLILSINELLKRSKNCYYFPAFELVNDDLRDHRFYKEDLAHPNELAINYIWEKFSNSCFNEKTASINKQINKLNLALDHREMTAGTQEKNKLQDFITKQKEELKKLHPDINF
jgi:GSCFA family